MNEKTVEELEARAAEIDAMNIDEMTDAAAVTALADERDAIAKEIETREAIAAAEERKCVAIANGEIGENAKPVIEERKDDKPMNEIETRANSLMENHRMELRALLSTGTIAKPTKAGGINPMANDIGTIVDDVTAVPLTGNGAYVAAYQKTNAVAANVTDGNVIGGTEATFGYVTINPSEWGIVGQISRQVKKVSPLAYEAAVENAALNALRAKAESVIYAAIQASALAEAKSYSLNVDYLRDLFLGFKAIPGKGGVKLYLCRADLTTLAHVRGTNEKAPRYTITFDAGSTTSGTIAEGGFNVPFCITEDVATGTQLFGQPATVEMPMWDEYVIETDESRYFEMNQIGYRGVQTANADLCALHGMQVITAS